MVTGSTGAHDPEIAKSPSGTYPLAHTGSGVTLKTSTDRTRWNGAGTRWEAFWERCARAAVRRQRSGKLFNNLDTYVGRR